MRFQSRAAVVLAVIIVTVSLGGCLVEKNKGATKTYTSLTNVLHTYVAGNSITYDLIKNTSSGTTTGTLEIKWESTNSIQDPFNPDTRYSVLKETTSICYGSSVCLSSSADASTVRLIEQDSSGETSGTIYLRAIDDPAADTHYWLNSDGFTTTGLGSFKIFRSPILLGSTNALQIIFNVMEGCSGTTCQQSVGDYSNYLEAVDYPVTVSGTGRGTFTNAYKVTVSGNVAPKDQPLPFFDFLDICHASASTLPTNHNGTLSIIPEVGVIKIVNNCQSGTDPSESYIATLRDTNIPLPPLTN